MRQYLSLFCNLELVPFSIVASSDGKAELELGQSMEGLSFVILYGSQLGQAKSLAEGLVDVARDYDLTTQAFPLNEVKVIKELGEISKPIVIITSTTGDGEAPENADKFFRKLRRKTLDSNTLNSVRYSILGLGDTNYNDFCNCGKTVHKRFQDLGAKLFYPAAWADDAVGQDKVIEDWIEGLWPTILTEIGAASLNFNMGESEGPSLTLPPCPQPFIQLNFVENGVAANPDLLKPPAPYPSIDGEPFLAKLTNAKLLTKEGSVKNTFEVTLTLVGVDFEFEPGDAIGIVCPNPAAEVETLLERLGLSAKENCLLELSLKGGAKGKFPVFLPRESTFHDLFTYFLDIRTAPKKALLRLLAEATTDPAEKLSLLELCSREGGAKYEETIRFPSLSILDILLKYPSCRPSAESLLEHLPRLAPRAYSIASSPLSSKTSFTLAFNIVEIPKQDGRMYERLGLCTGWFCELTKQFGLAQKTSIEDCLLNLSIHPTIVHSKRSLTSSIVLYKRKNHFFRLPAKLSAPIIMVGPGAGVAPFIGFLEHRHHQKIQTLVVGPMVLYFGCRHQEKDFLFRESLERLKTDEVLSQLNVAFSRDPDQGGIKYVQDLMERNADNIVTTLLENGGYLYVCGDAKNMAKSIREKLVTIISNVKGCTEKEASDKVAEIIAEKRYLQDIWT